jgi:hypothetical protein
MQKISTIFDRGHDGKLLPIPNDDASWVFEAPWTDFTVQRKWDGLCCKIEGGKLYKRRSIRAGQEVPPDWEQEHIVLDQSGGLKEAIGWQPVDPARPEDMYHAAGWENLMVMFEGSCELVGPGVEGNHDGHDVNMLLEHLVSPQLAKEFPRSFEGIREVLDSLPWEGLIFRHRDGRLAKIKREDYGLPWPVKR